MSQERLTQILSQGRLIQKLSQGGLTKRTVFNDTIAKMVKAMAVVYLEKGEPIRAPQVPIEEVLVEQAMRENTPKWKAALRSKLTSLLEANTFNIIKGKPSLEIKVISSRLVLRNKM